MSKRARATKPQKQDSTSDDSSKPKESKITFPSSAVEPKNKHTSIPRISEDRFGRPLTPRGAHGPKERN